MSQVGRGGRSGGQSGGGPGLELVGRAGPLLGWPGRIGRRHRAGTRARACGAGPGTRTIHSLGNGCKLFRPMNLFTVMKI